MDEIFLSIDHVRTRIRNACLRAGRPEESVTLVAVTKTVDPAVILRAYEYGLRDFGENRPQELRRKAPLLPEDARWHMIGHLQRNKIADVISTAARIHSVDSARLLEALEPAAAAVPRTVPAYLEVNISREPQKHGWLAEDLDAALAHASAFPHIDVCGLMTVAADSADQDLLRAQFRSLRELRDRVGTPAWDLSMGMSHDFELAIEEGATVVRVGSAIFGERFNAPHPA